MTTFVKLTETNKLPTWVNLDLVRHMHRLPAYDGDRYGDYDENGEWVEQKVGVKPDRTRLSFGTFGEGDDDFMEVLETPEQILLAAGRQS